MTKLISRNTTIPTKKSQVFSTAADGQTAIEVKIYQGERELVRDNKLLGNFNLVGIPPAPKGVPQIEITFDIDAGVYSFWCLSRVFAHIWIDGIVNVAAKDKATNKDQSMTIASSSGLSDKEIERMVSESEQYAEQDKARRDIIEESNKAESVCVDTEKGMSLLRSCLAIIFIRFTAMNEFKDQLDAAEKDKVTKHVTELREIAAKGQAGDGAVTADAIREKINEAQQASLSLFQKVGNHSLIAVYHPHAIVMYRSTRRRTPRTHLPLQRRRGRRKRRRIKLFLVRSIISSFRCVVRCVTLLPCRSLPII
jgi:molecular chaperone DnaK